MTALVFSKRCLQHICHLRLCGVTILLTTTTIAISQDVIPWQDAANYYGQIKTVGGTIVETKNTGKVCFLNFSPNWRTDFTAVIFASDFSKFPPNPEAYYRGKKVRVTGNIQEYRGKPEIILKSQSQIVVVGNEKPQGSALAPQVEAVSAYAARQPAASASANSQAFYVTKTGTKYHRAGCSSLSKSMIPMPLTEAAARYGPCSRCRPPTLGSAGGSTGAVSSETPTGSDDGRCQAITQKGTQCSRRASAGSRYCWQHGR
jgi:hypothetical protein